MATKNLLVELLVEELPPKALKALGEAFARGLLERLRAQGLAGEHAAATAYATPRRLAAHISAVAPFGADKAVAHKLMPVTVGLDANGAPTRALLKKLAALGADGSAVATLARRVDGKGEALFLDSVVKGASLADGLQLALTETLARLPIPKVMQYQLDDGWTSVNFVRPAHGLVALHGADVVAVRALGLTAGRQTRGHRFEATLDPVVLQHADHYVQQLETQAAVIASFAARHGEIARQLQSAAARQGLTPIDDAALLDEVTALVERPNVVACQFDPEFLAVPPECLILTMKANQKYFPLLDAEGRLTHRFLVVSNISPADASRVIEGNERVVRPRLADAKFFYDQDRKRPLESRVAALDKVVYHGKLGSQGERTQRVRSIARALGERLGGDALASKADAAARLAKADLVTDMVGEFPELQGTMGRYYALNDGVDADVADAIEDHYRPRFSGDALPRGAVGVVVALADKLEALVGLFGIGQVPTGDKDPYALRRHGFGVVRLLIERDLDLPVGAALDEATRTFGSVLQGGDCANAVPAWRVALERFLSERLNTYLRGDLDYTSQEVEAARGADTVTWRTIVARLEAVRAFAAMPEANSLAAANKRVANILAKVENEVEANVDLALLREPAELALSNALAATRPKSDGSFERGEFTASLQALAELKAPVDAFFDAVMVNADDPALRANRLGLLAQLRAAMNRVADLSKLAT